MTPAAVLRGLHRRGAPLVLPNVWDCRSARLVQAAGFPAVATSSAAIADSLGHRDGQDTPVGDVLDAIARIVDAVSVPVTADLERGYGLAPAELVQRLEATGAVGCNLEDSDPRTGTLLDAEEQAEFLSGVRAAAEADGIDVVINARIDTALADPAASPAETLRRARLYRDAGADCVYPILLRDREVITDLIASAGVPVNLLAETALSVPELARLGAARVSFGPHVYRRSTGYLAEVVDEIATASIC